MTGGFYVGRRLYVKYPPLIPPLFSVDKYPFSVDKYIFYMAYVTFVTVKVVLSGTIYMYSIYMPPFGGG
jgi:hypothetical protein